MKNNGGNFLNDAEIHGTTTVHLIMMIVPFIGLFLIFLFRRPLSRIPKRTQRIIFGTLGGLILTFELTQDITKIVAASQTESIGAAVKHQVLEMLELCRLNTILLGTFLLFNKIHGIKGIAGTTLFGGGSTIYDHGRHPSPTQMAEAGGVIKHGVILTMIPALAIASHSEKFTLKNLGVAHIFNYTYVALVVTLNYTVPMSDGSYTRSIGNLNEAGLADNAMVGGMPFGGRIFMYVFFITLIFGIWGGVENLIHRYTNYARKVGLNRFVGFRKIKMKFNKGFKKQGSSVLGTLVGLLALALVITGLVYTINISSVKGTYHGIQATDAQKAARAAAAGITDQAKIDAAVKAMPDGLSNGFPMGNYSFSGVPTMGYVLMGFTVLIALGAMIFLGGGLKGAKGMSRSNPYIKGQVYVRTRLQKNVFRVACLLIATLLIGSFTTEALGSDILGFTDGRKAIGEIGNYILSPASGYFQCFLSSLFIGLALIFKKYNGMPVLMPLALIGAVRTFADIKGDGGEDADGSSLYFNRFVIVHIMIVVGPLFVMISQRQSYSLVNIKRTMIYTFLMAFVAYMMYTFAAGGNKGVYQFKSAGEIEGVGSGGGYDDKGMNTHPQLLFGGMVVPFGLAVVVAVIFIYEFFNKKSVAEGNGARRGVSVGREGGSNIKNIQWPEFKRSFDGFMSFFFHQEKRKKQKVKYVSFGIKPEKGQISRDSYTGK